MDKTSDWKDEFLTLARLTLGGRQQDVTLFLGRTARRIRTTAPEVATEIANLLKNGSGRSSALRRENAVPLPVDSDSRLHLVKVETPPADMTSPVYAENVSRDVGAIIRERGQLDRLALANLEPTRSALFVGPPGVGKTMTARWIASQLNLPLLILDLSAVMSSYLGRTGNNVRTVLDYAKRQSCVLLLDELDAIAKRRDDASEIGELKRLVTVLLQEIDEWPADGLLLAASNHPELLDPAVWRRFDSVIVFPTPQRSEIEAALVEMLSSEPEASGEWVKILAGIFKDSNFSDIRRRVTNFRRSAAINNSNINVEIEEFVSQVVKSLPHGETIELATNLCQIEGISQRRAAELTGVSRDTMRKHRARTEKM